MAPEPSPVPTRSWELFLEAERCAVPLVRRIAECEPNETLSTEFRIRITERAEEEARRIESARRQLATAARIGLNWGWPVVALKGTAAAVDEREVLDLADVDILVEPQHAREFAAALDNRGYRPAGWSTPFHLSARSNGDLIKVEVHDTLDTFGKPLPESYWKRLRPVPAIDGVYLLSAADHLLHVLTHVVVSHPGRQGHLRELLLVGAAIEACAGEMTEVYRRIKEHPEKEALEEVLRAAQELRSGTAKAEALIRIPALGYAVREILVSTGVPEVITGPAHLWSLGFLMGPGARSVLWRQVWWVTRDPSAILWLRRLERRLPRVGRSVRLVVRLTRFAIAASLALPVAGISALTTRRVLNKAVTTPRGG
jgi:hypothetical protein